MSAFLGIHEPGFWLVVGVLCGVAVLAARPLLPRSWRTPLVAAYWLLIPYLGLVTGGLSPRLMGLVYLDWPGSLRLGAGLMVAALLVGGVVRLAVAPALAVGGGARTGAGWQLGLSALGLSGLEEWHWAFWRGAVTELLLSVAWPVTLPGYWAVWVAALLALPGAVLLQPNMPLRLVKVAILVSSTILFFYTRNFWLCWFLHVSLWLMLRQGFAPPRRGRW